MALSLALSLERGDWKLERWEEVSVYVEPVVVFLDEARSFVELGEGWLLFGVAGFFLVGGDEFDDAALMVGLSLLSFENRQADPAGGLEGLLKGGWVGLFSGFGMLGVDEVVEVVFAVGGVARSHEGFGCGG